MSGDHSSILTEDEFTGRPELVKKRARAIFWQRLAIALVVLYMVVSMTLVTISSLEGMRARKILLDCTTPGGTCYAENTKRTAKVVNGINAGTKEIVVLAAACSNNLALRERTTAKIEACVNKELEKRHGHPPNR